MLCDNGIDLPRVPQSARAPECGLSEYPERLAPNPQVQRRYYLPRSLRRRKASLFPTRPRPVRLPCRRGSTPIRSKSATRVVASVSTRRRNQSLLDPRVQERDLGNARQMSLPRLLRQRRLEGIREPIPRCGFPRQQGCRPETWRPLSSRQSILLPSANVGGWSQALPSNRAGVILAARASRTTGFSRSVARAMVGNANAIVKTAFAAR